MTATVGIVVYELRNSQLYEAAMHRAKVLEKRLRDDSSYAAHTVRAKQRARNPRRSAVAGREPNEQRL